LRYGYVNDPSIVRNLYAYLVELLTEGRVWDFREIREGSTNFLGRSGK
jgi:hypothetical protein